MFDFVLIGSSVDSECDVVAEDNVGDVGVDVVALSSSARRHACEQYTVPLHSRSQARQKSWKQSIVAIDVGGVNARNVECRMVEGSVATREKLSVL